MLSQLIQSVQESCDNGAVDGDDADAVDGDGDDAVDGYGGVDGDGGDISRGLVQSVFRHPVIIIFVPRERRIILLTYKSNYVSFSHHWQGSIDFNTVRSTHPTGMHFLIHP